MSSPSTSSSSSSSSPSSIHHASLVDPATHSPALLELLDIKISRQVIEYVVDCVVETVDYAMGHPTASTSRGRSATRRPEHEKFTTFVTNVLTRAEVTTSTLLCALVYIDRAKPHLHIGLEQWALERVFLGSLIVASKYLNDSTLKNVHWALCTGVFGKRDVGRIEREYLDVLNFELGITEDDLLSHHQGLAAVSNLSLSPRQPTAVFTHPHSHSDRRHTHARESTVPAVPELEPSSPVSTHSSSSSSFYSPRTPSTMNSSPPSPDSKEQAQSTLSSLPSNSKPAPIAAAPTTGGHTRKIFTAAHASTMELLRSFPIPRMHTS
ncbi:hypothetical protein B0H34DRAFT_652080 [Crassisporium funariophilum]|nr:hypothetical protein B0H34DRAFT_652080 [Crassisporium funariophilum]